MVVLKPEKTCHIQSQRMNNAVEHSEIKQKKRKLQPVSSAGKQTKFGTRLLLISPFIGKQCVLL